MKRSRRSSSSTTTTKTTVIHTFYNDHNTPPSTKEIPVDTPSPPTKSTVQTKDSSTVSSAAAAARIQSGYRSSKIRALYKTIASVNREANRVQSLIQRQETVDAIRTDEKERLKMNETLMRLLLKLDSVPGSDPSIREARRKVSRKIVGMQEILDSISESKEENQWWPNYDLGVGGGAWPLYWEEAVEEEMCREKGGEEMEKFCAQYLGFRCFQRFLRE